MKEYNNKTDIYIALQEQLETSKNLRDILSETVQSMYNISEICADCLNAGLAFGTDTGFNIKDLRVIVMVGKNVYNAAEALKQFVEKFDSNITESQKAINRTSNQ